MCVAQAGVRARLGALVIQGHERPHLRSSLEEPEILAVVEGPTDPSTADAELPSQVTLGREPGAGPGAVDEGREVLGELEVRAGAQ